MKTEQAIKALLAQAEEDLQTQRNNVTHYRKTDNEFRLIAAREAVLKLKGRIEAIKEILGWITT